MTNNNGKNTKDTGGIVRAVPIILCAAALFIAICFIFGGTGAFGYGVSSVLRGLFAGGAYSIPLFLILHALLFKDDYANGTAVSRIVFSLIAVLIVSSIDYTICYFGKEPVFDPALFYTNQTAGGFVGGIFSFCITKIIGSVGLIILDITVVTAAAIVSFGKKDSTARKGILGFLEFFTYCLSLIEKKIKKSVDDRHEAKAEKKRQETERHHAQFLNDQFFETSDMDELSINQLGIHESRDPKSAERRPNLHTKVFNRSAISKEELERERAEREKYVKAEQKKASFNFNIESTDKKDEEKDKKAASSRSDLGSVFFGNSDSKFGDNHIAYDVRENAEDVFTKDFDPFDFATGEKLVAKQSTRASSSSKKIAKAPDADSLFYVTEESIAESKRLAEQGRRRDDFEMRKARLFEKKGYTPRAKAPEPTPQTTENTVTEEPSVNTVNAPETVETKAESSVSEPATNLFRPAAPHAITTEATFGTRPDFEEAEFVPAVVTETIDENVEFSQISDDDEIRKIAESAAWGRPQNIPEEEEAEQASAETVTFGDPNEKDFDTVAEEIAELVRMNNPGYARSANKSVFTTVVRGDVNESEPAAKEPEAPAVTESVPPTEEKLEEAEPETDSPVPEETNDIKKLARAIPLVIEDVTYTTPKKEETQAGVFREEIKAFDATPSVKSAEESAVKKPIETPEVENASEKAPSFKEYTPPPVAEKEPVKTAPILITERELLTPANNSANDIFLEREIARYDSFEEAPAEEPKQDPPQKITHYTAPKPTPDPEVIYTNEVSYTHVKPAATKVNYTYSEVAAPKVNYMPAVSHTEPAEKVVPIEPIKETVFKNEEKPVPAAAVTPTIDDSLFAESDEIQKQEPVMLKEETGTVFTFEEEDEEEAYIFDPSDPDAFAEEDDGSEDLMPIPPEEQNPDVIKQRAMFPFLDGEKPAVVSTPAAQAPIQSHRAAPTQTAVVTEVKENVQKSEAKSEAEEEIIPFDEDPRAFIKDEEPPFEVEKKPETAVVAAEEKPKKKDYSDYVFPPIDLLHAAAGEGADEDVAREIQDNADKLIDTLASFGVTASIKGVDRGPRITRYEVVPARGTKVSSIMNLDNDIALNLAADGIRMEAPIPGKTAVGVEIPNKKASLVRLRELIETVDYRDLKSKTTVCMGKDVAGQPIFADVAKMPHALVAGATGMGKSVWINSLMLSILYKARPDEVKFIMIDPKQVEFTMYNGIPHLLVPVVTDVKQAAGTLMWAVEEMERRYGVLQELCVRNIDAYNDKVVANPALGEPMSRIVIVIDEFAELIMQAKNPVESLIIRIAQKARAAGIHLIIGTQKPVKEVITGLIKSNIPSKFSCKVASNRDSILIFDAAGAEKLLDKGDMLVSFANSIKPLRVQSAFVADDEVEAVMDYLKQFSDGQNYDETVMEEIKRAADKCSKKGGGDRDDDDEEEGSYGEGYLNNKQFLDAVELAVNTGKISTSLIQRKISIGYGKAAKFIDVMEDMGVVGEANGSKPREVLLTADEWHEKLSRTSYN